MGVDGGSLGRFIKFVEHYLTLLSKNLNPHHAIPCTAILAQSAESRISARELPSRYQQTKINHGGASSRTPDVRFPTHIPRHCTHTNSFPFHFLTTPAIALISPQSLISTCTSPHPAHSQPLLTILAAAALAALAKLHARAKTSNERGGKT